MTFLWALYWRFTSDTLQKIGIYFSSLYKCEYSTTKFISFKCFHKKNIYKNIKNYKHFRVLRTERSPRIKAVLIGLSTHSVGMALMRGIDFAIEGSLSPLGSLAALARAYRAAPRLMKTLVILVEGLWLVSNILMGNYSFFISK